MKPVINGSVLVASLGLFAGTIGFPKDAPDPLRVSSLDGNVAITFSLQPDGVPAYKVDYFGKPIVLESRLGLEPDLTNHFAVTATSPSSHEGQWTNLFGERRIVPDNYRQLDIALKHES